MKPSSIAVTAMAILVSSRHLSSAERRDAAQLVWGWRHTLSNIHSLLRPPFSRKAAFGMALRVLYHCAFLWIWRKGRFHTGFDKISGNTAGNKKKTPVLECGYGELMLPVSVFRK